MLAACSFHPNTAYTPFVTCSPAPRGGRPALGHLDPRRLSVDTTTAPCCEVEVRRATTDRRPHNATIQCTLVDTRARHGLRSHLSRPDPHIKIPTLRAPRRQLLNLRRLRLVRWCGARLLSGVDGQFHAPNLSTRARSRRVRGARRVPEGASTARRWSGQSVRLP